MIALPASLVSPEHPQDRCLWGCRLAQPAIESDSSAAAARIVPADFFGSAPFRVARAGREANRMRGKVPELVPIGLDIRGHPLHNESDKEDEG